MNKTEKRVIREVLLIAKLCQKTNCNSCPYYKGNDCIATINGYQPWAADVEDVIKEIEIRLEAEEE